ncbi:MAG TPA: hypothetical protein VK991_15625 [Halomonas sp.]|nr:hypothetical protein [Halomonas sp.]
MQAMMSTDALLQLMLTFPLVLFSLLIGLLGVYWLLVLVRLAPVELFERDSLRDDTLASAMVSLGFVGVPVSVTLTLLAVVAGALTLAVEVLVLQHLNLGMFRAPLGIVVLWAAFALASPVVAIICRGLQHYFHRSSSLPRSLLGECAVVKKPEGEKPGLAEAALESDADRRVWLRVKADQALYAGERRVLVKYLRDRDAYRSVPEQDFLDARTRLVKLRLVERHHRRKESGSSHSDSNHNGNGAASSA